MGWAGAFRAKTPSRRGIRTNRQIGGVLYQITRGRVNIGRSMNLFVCFGASGPAGGLLNGGA